MVKNGRKQKAGYLILIFLAGILFISCTKTQDNFSNGKSLMEEKNREQFDELPQGNETLLPEGELSQSRENAINELDFYPSQEARNRAETIVAQIVTPQMSQLERVKVLHDYIVNRVNYDLQGLQNETIRDRSFLAEGALSEGLAVCQGYAQGFALLCIQADIPVKMVYGSATDESGIVQSHAWNLVQLKGQWYHIDCTWDDPIINGEVVTDGSNCVWNYFLLTDEEIRKNHIVDTGRSVSLPVCADTAYQGFGEQLTLEAALGDPSYVAEEEKEAYKAAKKFVKEGYKEFFLAIPLPEELDHEKLGGAVSKAALFYKFAFQCTVELKYHKTGNYMVYDILLDY